jgi:hypothetical protein
MTPLGKFYAGNRLHSFPNPENASLLLILGKGFGSENGHFFYLEITFSGAILS